MNQPAPALVVRGVSGCGKSTIGAALAARLGWTFQEGDDFHPPANVAKMRAGIPLDDADRAPWLAAIGGWIDALRAPGVVSCSALKRGYRDTLRDGRPQVWFLYLHVSRVELQHRVDTRHHQYMPALLLDSQLATLQAPAPEEPRMLTVDADGSIDATVTASLAALRGANLGAMRISP